MKILLIAAIDPYFEPHSRFPNLGLGYLASALLHKFPTIDIRITGRDVKKTLTSWRPDLVGITSISANYDFAKQYAKDAKQLNIPVIIGGPHITTLPETMTEDMDVAVMGEGEETIVELVEALQTRPSVVSDIKGIAYRDETPLTPGAFAAALLTRLRKFDATVLVEPGRFMVGNAGALLVWAAQITSGNRWRALLRTPGLPHMMGMFTKIDDTPAGKIHVNGSIDKPYLAEDQEKFNQGTETCRKILIKAGARPDSICVANNIGGHPGGTAAIGKVVGKDLQALQVKNLYVCDASVFPHSPGRPPTLTIIALAKHLAKAM